MSSSGIQHASQASTSSLSLPSTSFGQLPPAKKKKKKNALKKTSSPAKTVDTPEKKAKGPAHKLVLPQTQKDTVAEGDGCHSPCSDSLRGSSPASDLVPVERLVNDMVATKIRLPKEDVEVSEPEKKKFEYQFRMRSYHMTSVRQGKKVYRCDVCAGIYRHAFSLKRHFIRNHLNYKYLSAADIANCNINIIGPIPAQLPGDPTESGDLFRCHLCNHYFKDKVTLKRHIMHHPDMQKQFSCTECEMTFTHKQNLVRHLSVHQTGRSFTCRQCNKHFPTLANLRRHERIHQGLKPYVCDQCGGSFTQSSDLRKHIKKLHFHNYHPCEHCSRYFTSWLALKEHLKKQHSITMKTPTASPEKKEKEKEPEETVPLPDDSAIKYSCNDCSKGFATYVNLCRHRRTAHQVFQGKRCSKGNGSIDNNNNNNNISVSTKSRTNSFSKLLTYEQVEIPEAEFYMTVAQRISDNLLNYVDGKVLSYNMQRLENGTTLPLFQQIVPWEKYNFSSDFDSKTLEKRENLQAGNNQNSVAYQHLNIQSEVCFPDPFAVEDTLVTSDSESDDSLDSFLSTTTKETDDNQSVIGREVPVTYICSVCMELFRSDVSIEDHKINNHPNVFCTHIEIEGEKEVPPEMCHQFCSPIGAICQCSVPAQHNSHLLCTKCSSTFDNVPDLHQHILECGTEATFTRQPQKFNGAHYSRRHGQTVKRQSLWSPNMKRKRKKGSVDLNDLASKQELQCSECQLSFQHSSVLERHMKGCSAQEMCSNVTVVLSDPEKVHVCSHCKKAFVHASSLRKHLKNVCRTGSKKKKKRKLHKNISGDVDDASASVNTPCFNQEANLVENMADEKSSPVMSNKYITEEEAYSAVTVLQTEESVVKIISSDILSQTDDCKNQFLKTNCHLSKNVSIQDDEDCQIAQDVHSALEDVIKTVEEVEEEFSARNSIFHSSDNEAYLHLSSEESFQHLTAEEILKIKQEYDFEDIPNYRVSETSCQPKRFRRRFGIKTEGEESAVRSAELLHTCPHCLRGFSYLANYRKHVRDVCPILKQASSPPIAPKQVSPSPIVPSVSPVQTPSPKENPVPVPISSDSQLKQCDSLGKQIANNELNSKFKSFPCSACPKIFFSYWKLLQHTLSHKLKDPCDSEVSDEPSKHAVIIVDNAVNTSTEDDKRFISCAGELPPSTMHFDSSRPKCDGLLLLTPHVKKALENFSEIPIEEDIISDSDSDDVPLICSMGPEALARSGLLPETFSKFLPEAEDETSDDKPLIEIASLKCISNNILIDEAIVNDDVKLDNSTIAAAASVADPPLAGNDTESSKQNQPFSEIGKIDTDSQTPKADKKTIVSETPDNSPVIMSLADQLETEKLVTFGSKRGSGKTVKGAKRKKVLENARNTKLKCDQIAAPFNNICKSLLAKEDSQHKPSVSFTEKPAVVEKPDNGVAFDALIMGTIPKASVNTSSSNTSVLRSKISESLILGGIAKASANTGLSKTSVSSSKMSESLIVGAIPKASANTSLSNASALNSKTSEPLELEKEDWFAASLKPAEKNTEACSPVPALIKKLRFSEDCDKPSWPPVSVNPIGSKIGVTATDQKLPTPIIKKKLRFADEVDKNVAKDIDISSRYVRFSRPVATNVTMQNISKAVISHTILKKLNLLDNPIPNTERISLSQGTQKCEEMPPIVLKKINFSQAQNKIAPTISQTGTSTLPYSTVHLGATETYDKVHQAPLDTSEFQDKLTTAPVSLPSEPEKMSLCETTVNKLDADAQLVGPENNLLLTVEKSVTNPVPQINENDQNNIENPLISKTDKSPPLSNELSNSPVPVISPISLATPLLLESPHTGVPSCNDPKPEENDANSLENTVTSLADDTKLKSLVVQEPSSTIVKKAIPKKAKKSKESLLHPGEIIPKVKKSKVSSKASKLALEEQKPVPKKSKPKKKSELRAEQKSLSQSIVPEIVPPVSSPLVNKTKAKKAKATESEIDKLCPDCNKVFETKVKRNHHVRTVHRKKTVEVKKQIVQRVKATEQETVKTKPVKSSPKSKTSPKTKVSPKIKVADKGKLSDKSPKAKTSPKSKLSPKSKVTLKPKLPPKSKTSPKNSASEKKS